jgi:hypothetical protein
MIAAVAVALLVVLVLPAWVQAQTQQDADSWTAKLSSALSVDQLEYGISQGAYNSANGAQVCSAVLFDSIGGTMTADDNATVTKLLAQNADYLSAANAGLVLVGGNITSAQGYGVDSVFDYTKNDWADCVVACQAGVNDIADDDVLLGLVGINLVSAAGNQSQISAILGKYSGSGGPGKMP